MIKLSSNHILMKYLFSFCSLFLMFSSISQTPGPGVSDIDGNSYSTVYIGNQEWIVGNLRTTKYANGDPINNITDAGLWGSAIDGAWSHYDNNSALENVYGKLYNWYAVNDSRNVCPTGWHVPNNVGLGTLALHIDNTADTSVIGVQSSTAGGDLKSTSVSWTAPNTGATNSYGFVGEPGGIRLNSGAFFNLGNNAAFWSSSGTVTDGYYLNLYYLSADYTTGTFGKNFGASVRCVKYCSSDSVFNKSSCNSYQWPSNGDTYSSSGIYYDTLSNQLGCDSILILDLTINNSSTTNETITACGSYLWPASNTLYTTGGNYSAILTDQNQCDSTINLDLTINSLPSVSVTQSGAELTADQTGSIYQWLDCNDNFSIINGETGQSYTPVATGNYAVSVNDNGCTDTSDCFLVDYNGFDDLSKMGVVVFPNPTREILNIKVTGSLLSNEYLIYDQLGRLLDSGIIANTNTVIDVSRLEEGIYYIQIKETVSRFVIE